MTCCEGNINGSVTCCSRCFRRRASETNQPSSSNPTRQAQFENSIRRPNTRLVNFQFQRGETMKSLISAVATMGFASLLGVMVPTVDGPKVELVRPIGVAKSCKAKPSEAKRGDQWSSAAGPVYVAQGDGTFSEKRRSAADTGDLPTLAQSPEPSSNQSILAGPIESVPITSFRSGGNSSGGYSTVSTPSYSSAASPIFTSTPVVVAQSRAVPRAIFSRSTQPVVARSTVTQTERTVTRSTSGAGIRRGLFGRRRCNGICSF